MRGGPLLNLCEKEVSMRLVGSPGTGLFVLGEKLIESFNAFNVDSYEWASKLYNRERRLAEENSENSEKESESELEEPEVEDEDERQKNIDTIAQLHFPFTENVLALFSGCFSESTFKRIAGLFPKRTNHT